MNPLPYAAAGAIADAAAHLFSVRRTRKNTTSDSGTCGKVRSIHCATYGETGTPCNGVWWRRGCACGWTGTAAMPGGNCANGFMNGKNDGSKMIRYASSKLLERRIARRLKRLEQQKARPKKETAAQLVRRWIKETKGRTKL